MILHYLWFAVWVNLFYLPIYEVCLFEIRVLVIACVCILCVLRGLLVSTGHKAFLSSLMQSLFSAKFKILCHRKSFPQYYT